MFVVQPHKRSEGCKVPSSVSEMFLASSLPKPMKYVNILTYIREPCIYILIQSSIPIDAKSTYHIRIQSSPLSYLDWETISLD